MNKFFNATHSPVGAFASFTLGHKGACGGFCSFLGKPADSNMYIGYGGGTDYKFLPFFDYNKQTTLKSFTNEQSFGKSDVKIEVYDDDEITRNYNIGTDEFATADFSFKIYTPQFELSENFENKLEICPAIICSATVKNVTNENKYFVFGSDKYDQEASFRHEPHAIAQGLNLMIKTNNNKTFSACHFSLEDMLNPCSLKHENTSQFMLAENGCLITEIEKNTTVEIIYSISFYKPGVITSLIPCRMMYTKYFNNIEEVADYSLTQSNTIIKRSKELDKELDNKGLSKEKKFQVALTTNNYYSSSELLVDENESPIYLVNEGEYRMMNTLDLCVDHLFFELEKNAWVVKNSLEFYYKNYSYVDKIKTPDGLKDGGLTFCHDVGNINQFSPRGTSSYELSDLSGCFSFMSFEQLTNYIIIFSTYIIKTEDYDYLKKRTDLYYELIHSLLIRIDENGFMKYNSSKTKSGSEITTYDSLDASLGSSVNSTYLLSKTFSSLALLNEMAKYKKDEHTVQKLEVILDNININIDQCIKNELIISHLNSKKESYIIPVVEGLVYLKYLKLTDYISIDGRYNNYVKKLKVHTDHILKDICLFPNGGYKLSSTSTLTWLSKIYISMYIHEELFAIDKKIIEKANKAHVEWLTSKDNSYYAYSDQINNGLAHGSKYYPRGVTSILWTL